VQVNVVSDPRASSLPHVNPNIHALGLVRLNEYQLGETSQFHEFSAFFK
jgi:hypothetical protein|tara:strand:+ start:21069 stop:21215 length:147 start_codon:yes stop_codon:yes gene_type:complete